MSESVATLVPLRPAGPQLAAGDAIGDYRLVSLLGRGGMGSVYEAIHPVIGSRVAIKVLDSARSADGRAVARFVQEARVVNEIRHPNVVAIFNFSQLPDGRHYYVMERLDGVSLRERLARARALPLAEALAVVRGLAAALDAAHAKGVVHRDLKPDNVFLTGPPPHGVKLLDFGIAKLTDGPAVAPSLRTDSDQVVGTPFYMSPEQCRGAAVDARSDVYALGVLAYEMLTGSRPFTASTFGELLLLQQTATPPAPSSIRRVLPVALDSVLGRALEKQPAARYPQAGALAGALEQAAAGALEPLSPGGSDPATPAPGASSAILPFEPTVAARPPDASPMGATPSTPRGWAKRARVVRRVSVAVVLLGALLGGLAGLLARQRSVATSAPSTSAPARPASLVERVRAAAPAPTPVAAPPHRIRIVTRPAHAQVALDGTPVAGEAAELPRDGRSHTLTVTAPRHVRRSVPLDERTPTTLEVALERAPRPRARTRRPVARPITNDL